jgi:hypothetical protein
MRLSIARIIPYEVILHGKTGDRPPLTSLDSISTLSTVDFLVCLPYQQKQYLY